MNERIEELALQAGLKKPYGSDREYIGDFDWRQFGKLLIKQCVSICDDRYICNGNDGEGWLLAREIEEHFGVAD